MRTRLSLMEYPEALPKNRVVVHSVFYSAILAAALLLPSAPGPAPAEAYFSEDAGMLVLVGKADSSAEDEDAPAATSTHTEGLLATTTSPAGVAGAASPGIPEYVPREAPYHYGDKASLTNIELIAIASAALFGALGGGWLIRQGGNLRRRAEREEERAALGLPVDAYEVAELKNLAGTRRLSGVFLMFAATGIFVGALYGEQLRTYHPIVFSEQAMLRQLWNDYKANYVEAETGRTLDRQKENITTSEGQSYTLLRAAWMDDRPVFDLAYQWTKDNLQRPDRLHAWLFGERADGTYGVIASEGGANSASDAETDIALALLFAYARWGDQEYLDEARAIIDAVGDKEIVTVKGVPYLAANDIEKHATTEHILLNPSYFAPYAYRLFAALDPSHPWMALVDSSYDVLERSSALPLNREKSVGLPPNWLFLDRESGALVAAPDSDFGFDAMRVPWRVALDARWFGEPRAKEALQGFSFLGKEWDKRGALSTVYAHDGTAVYAAESPAFYGASLGYFAVMEPKRASELYRKKLETLYNPDTVGWREFMNYYDDNWAWFGMALQNGALPNLTATLARSTP